MVQLRSESTSEERLERALRVVAEIVASEPQYMPLLDRISDELQALRTKREQLERLLGQLEPPTIDLVAVQGNDAAT